MGNGYKMFSQIIIGILGMAIGVYCVIGARKIVGWFGTSATLEYRLGPAGTYFFLRIFGIFLFVIFLLYTIGYLDDVIRSILYWFEWNFIK